MAHCRSDGAGEAIEDVFNNAGGVGRGEGHEQKGHPHNRASNTENSAQCHTMPRFVIARSGGFHRPVVSLLVAVGVA